MRVRHDVVRVPADKLVEVRVASHLGLVDLHPLGLAVPVRQQQGRNHRLHALNHSLDLGHTSDHHHVCDRLSDGHRHRRRHAWRDDDRGICQDAGCRIPLQPVIHRGLRRRAQRADAEVLAPAVGIRAAGAERPARFTGDHTQGNRAGDDGWRARAAAAEDEVPAARGNHGRGEHVVHGVVVGGPANLHAERSHSPRAVGRDRADAVADVAGADRLPEHARDIRGIEAFELDLETLHGFGVIVHRVEVRERSDDHGRLRLRSGRREEQARAERAKDRGNPAA